MPLDVLLADEEQIGRDGIKALLSRHGDFRVVGEAENGPDAVELCERLRPHFVLMDIGLAGLNGVETIKKILGIHGDCKIVILSMSADKDSAKNAFRAGARGVILKSAAEKELADALEQMADGAIYISPQTSEQFKRVLRGNLSPRDFEHLQLIISGKRRKKISNLFGLWRRGPWR